MQAISYKASGGKKKAKAVPFKPPPLELSAPSEATEPPASSDDDDRSSDEEELPEALPEALREAIRPETRMIWVETPTHPPLKTGDIAAAAECLSS